MTPVQAAKTILRLQKYVEVVQNNIATAKGDLKEFWQRELKKTSSKIASLR